MLSVGAKAIPSDVIQNQRVMNLFWFMKSMDKPKHPAKHTPKKSMTPSGKNFIFTFTKNLRMFEVEFFPLYGFTVGFNYSNDDLLDINEEKDFKHTIQVFIGIFGFNINWYIDK